MTNKEKIFGKRVTEVANYLDANPLATRVDILAKFGKVWQTSDRTIDRIIKEAKKCIEVRQNLREKAKNEVLVRSAKEMAENAEKTRNELVGILLEIARGQKVRKIQDEIIIPTESDRIRAIAELNKMSGNYAPVLTAETDSKGNDIINTVNVNIKRQ
ncbi:MAG: hypothetical protein LBC68_11280 [Prevotellaceae bacterium]|jgi:hypothetical protein|nr:hypothetical protein [Prevotellaceae bacterium]